MEKKYVLRVRQNFKTEYENEFFLIEDEFIALQKKRDDYPTGKRLVPVFGTDMSNQLIWEKECDTMEECFQVIETLHSHPEHLELVKKQAHCLGDYYIEILKFFP